MPPAPFAGPLRAGHADPRRAALDVLNRLDRKQPPTLDRILDDRATSINRLDRRDRALFNQLVYGVLRHRAHLDGVIQTHASRPLKKITPAVVNTLRLALFQILYMDRIPDSAAVNTAVELVRRQKHSKVAGFVNAVLRNALRAPERFVLPDAATDPVAHLCLAHSLPAWLASRWIERMGMEEAQGLAAAINTIAPLTVRCNDLKSDLPGLLAALAVDVEAAEPLETVPGAVRLTGPRCAIGQLQAFDSGLFAVQDGAAQLASQLLAPQPGETVLDACAGLGGKTGHLAQLMENQGRIVALDHVAAKLKRLASEANRLGATIIETRTADLNRPLAPDALPCFDRILLDAPCSGLGVLRRNPDAKWSAEKKGIAGFARRQLRFLGHVAPLLKPGGTLVFVVCSMEPEENEAVIHQFLKNHPDFAITTHQSPEEKSVLPFVGEDGFLRTAPHIHDLDGFFAARLGKTEV